MKTLWHKKEIISDIWWIPQNW